MNFTVGCRLNYQLSSQSTIVFNVHAVQCKNQEVTNEEVWTTAGVTYDEWLDPATQNRFIRVTAGSGPLQITYRADVNSRPTLYDEDAIGEIVPSQLPLHVVPFLYPSRYCQSDRLVRLARDEFGDFQPGFSRVTAICNYIHDNIAYERGSSGEQTSAFDTVTERAGVCRDFAHLGITFCRSLGIPARFVSGYAYGLEPPDFHACFEAYLSSPNGGLWYFFDATRLAPQTGYVRIGSGRDASDVSFATLFGNIQFEGMEITMETQEEPPQFTTKAVALA